MRREGVRNGETLEKIRTALKEGKKPCEIARELGISRQAVYSHMDNIKGKGESKRKEHDGKTFKSKRKKYLINWSI